MLIRLLYCCACFLLFYSCKLMSKEEQKDKKDSKYAAVPDSTRKWWKEGVVYQIYPRSFKDSDGDGIGDLKGIISKLDYIKDLGVNIIWLNPVYGSPNDNNGYDISDYRGIMKEFGTIEDFDALLKGMHERGLKLVMDLVVNHSSDEHPWFKESRSSRTSPYRDYYHWWPAERGKPAKRWSFFDVNSDAWRYDSLTNAYYLHYFSVKQPDLNWEHPKLRKEVYDLMKFWFDKGIDGFRMDVIPFISKDTSFPELKSDNSNDYINYYALGPHNHEYLQEMYREVLSKYDVMTVGEGAGVQIGDALKYVDPARKELNMFFHFDAMGLDRDPNNYLQPAGSRYDMGLFKSIYSKWDSVFSQKGWGSIYLGNHDQPRVVSRWGSDKEEYRPAAAKMLQTFLLSMRATPYIYNGDELGMTNIRFTEINDYRDIQTLNSWKALQQTNPSKAQTDLFMKGQAYMSRDNSRTPFQWDATTNAGFSTGTPWIKVNPNYTGINAAAQVNDTSSVLNYFKKMVKLRKDNPVLVYGSYQLLDNGQKDIYAYLRILGKDTVLVMMNFSPLRKVFDIPTTVKFNEMEMLISNMAENHRAYHRSFMLLPYHAVIYRIK
jgi:oligo-1,6-glucosidase